MSREAWLWAAIVILVVLVGGLLIRGATMSSKAWLWLAIVFLVVAVGGLLIYSDYFGNIEYQKSLLDTFKVVVGAFVGAWANELTK